MIEILADKMELTDCINIDLGLEIPDVYFYGINIERSSINNISLQHLVDSLLMVVP